MHNTVNCFIPMTLIIKGSNSQRRHADVFDVYFFATMELTRLPFTL